MVRKLESIVYHAQRTSFVAVMAFVLLVLSLHVIAHFAFNNPVIWTDEAITIIQSTLAFAGIGYRFHKKQHTGLSLVYDKVPRPAQWLFGLASNGIVLFYTYYMIKYSWKFVPKENIQMNTIPWAKQSWIYCFIAMGFVLAACYIPLHLIEVFRCTNEESREGG